MKFRCLRCKSSGYIRRGEVTGERVASYTESRKTINNSGIVKLSHERTPNPLCPDCNDELADWLKDKNKHVK